MVILGISAFYHDSAAALVRDGVIVSAAQEERFTRKKHDANFPEQAIRFCLEQAGLTLDQVDHIVFFEKPLVKFERLLETYLAFAPRGFMSFKKAIPLWLKEKLFQKKLLTDSLAEMIETKPSKALKSAITKKLLFSEHHQSHAASAFFPSPFEKALVLTMDGVGEWASTSVGIGDGNTLTIQKEIHFPHSLGLLYSAFTYYTGFKVNSGEYKVMGLAPYGEPKYVDTIMNHLIDVKDDGSFRLNMDYFDYATGLTMTNQKFADLFGAPARTGETMLTQREMDLAASVQAVTEEVVRRMVKSLAREYPDIPNLCLAGGVALNCVANGKILKEGYFKNIWIQPAAGDAGGALGAALAAYYQHGKNPRVVKPAQDAMKGSYLGPEFSDDDIETRLSAMGAKCHRFANENDMIDATAHALAEEKAIGWFQGRMEFGPRALGGRSILGDARSPGMQKTLNLKVKYRESFRPFAPSVLREDVGTWFDLNTDSPYMLLVAPVNDNKTKPMTEAEQKLFGIDKLNIPRSDIPAVTHVDYSARIQTVHADTNPKYHALISKFKSLTGCPVIVNTSFNVRGEPIVGTPEDAFRCFMGTELDVLVVGNCVMYKHEQDPALAADYKDAFELD
ncbi:MAG: carbamoyltransferase [Alphaproteobacteria bacterium]|nr:carbamoyltransferase [Alphaproteobacteria bacterium]